MSISSVGRIGTALLVATALAGGCRSRDQAEARHLDVSVSGVRTRGLPLQQGTEVVVHLRRDAIGYAGNSAAGFDVDGPGRGAFSIVGTYVDNASPDWIALDREGRRFHVSVANVLAIEAVAPATRPMAMPNRVPVGRG